MGQRSPVPARLLPRPPRLSECRPPPRLPIGRGAPTIVAAMTILKLRTELGRYHPNIGSTIDYRDFFAAITVPPVHPSKWRDVDMGRALRGGTRHRHEARGTQLRSSREYGERMWRSIGDRTDPLRHRTLRSRVLFFFSQNQDGGKWEIGYASTAVWEGWNWRARSDFDRVFRMLIRRGAERSRCSRCPELTWV